MKIYILARGISSALHRADLHAVSVSPLVYDVLTRLLRLNVSSVPNENRRSSTSISDTDAAFSHPPLPFS